MARYVAFRSQADQMMRKADQLLVAEQTGVVPQQESDGIECAMPDRDSNEIGDERWHFAAVVADLQHGVQVRHRRHAVTLARGAEAVVVQKAGCNMQRRQLRQCDAHQPTRQLAVV